MCQRNMQCCLHYTILFATTQNEKKDLINFNLQSLQTCHSAECAIREGLDAVVVERPRQIVQMTEKRVSLYLQKVEGVEADKSIGFYALNLVSIYQQKLQGGQTLKQPRLQTCDFVSIQHPENYIINTVVLTTFEQILTVR